MAKKETVRICLWSGPRNISTAMMYSFAQRSDTKVYDEPLYGHYLMATDAKAYHPGADEVLDTMETDGEKVIEMMLGEHDTPVVFFKQMTHHLVHLDLSFLQETVNIILTRDPEKMLPSYAEQVPDPEMSDVGYQQHLELLNYLRQTAHPPIVVTADRILNNPEHLLKKLCYTIGIPFDRAMLSWERGPRPEDGIWAKYWYTNVHRSAGFRKPVPKKDPFPEHLLPLLTKCQPIYRELSRLAL